MANSQALICPTFVGRAPQLAVVQSMLADVVKGDTSTFRIALIAGEAGIGKSRFINEAMVSAERAGMTVLLGRCFEQDQSLPYAPLRDLLNQFCLEQTSQRSQQALEPVASELIRIFPELSMYLANVTPLPMLEPEQEKRRIFQAMLQFLFRAAPSSALLIVIEDLHWCDDLSLEFLLYLTRHHLPRPVLLLGTYRADERYEPLERVMTEWNRQRILTEISLPRLSLGEVDHMMRAVLNAQHPLPYDLLDVLYRLTEGNPFFLEEALKALVEAGDISRQTGEWNRPASGEIRVPRTVQHAVEHRLDRLTPAARKLLSLAAVIGRRFRVTLLQTLTGHSQEELMQALRELIQAQLMIEESADVYAFRHALTRETIYQNTLRLERKALHAVIGNAIEHLQDSPGESLLSDLSYHFFEAGEWEKAFQYARQAGERAQSLDATRAALLHFTRALESAQQMSRVPPLSVWRARGQCHQTLGNFEAARDDFENILRIARQSQDLENEWRSLLDLGFAWTSRDYQRAGEYFQQALESARRLNNPILLAQTLNRIGNWRYMSGDPEQGVLLHREALGIVETLGDTREIASTLDLLGISSFGFGDLLGGREHYEKAIALYRALGDRQGLIASLCAYGNSAGSYMTPTAVPALVELDTLIGATDEAVAIARQMGWRPSEAYALAIQAFSLGPHGEFGRVLSAAHTSLQIAAELEHEFFIVTAHFALGVLHMDLLDFESAREHLELAYALAKQTGAGFVTSNLAGHLVQTYLALNEMERAENLLQEALSDETPMNSESLRALWLGRVEWLFAKGRNEEARLLTLQLIPHVPHTRGQAVSPRLWLIQARSLRALDRHVDAEILLRDALHTAVSSMLLPLAWRIHLEWGLTLRAMRRISEAQEQFAAARTIVETLAGNLPEETMRDPFRQRALRLIPNPSEKEKVKSEFGGLTERERGIAVLVADGLSNADIAERLVLSRRTVEAHVANILAKLSLRTRAQIAAWAVEKGLGREA